MLQIILSLLLLSGTAFSQLFPSLPKFKADLGPLSLSIGKDRDGTTESIKLEPSDKNVIKKVGESYTVSCRPSDISANVEWRDPLSYRVYASESSRVRTTKVPEEGIDLIFSKIGIQDAGTYSCNSDKTTESFTLDVLEPLTFDTSLSEQTATVDSPYTLKCAARSASMKIQIKWKVDNQEINGSQENFQITKDSNLSIRKVGNDDGGRTYTCIAEGVGQSLSETKEMNIKLNVNPPSISTNKDDDKEFGQNSTCVCPSIELDGISDAENLNTLKVGTGRHNLDEIWERQSEIMELQQKTWKEVMRIADLVYAVQYGRRVVEITDNEQ